jgi:sulfate transporter 2, low-affinity
MYTHVPAFAGVVNIDTSGLTALEEIHKELVSLGLQVK